MEYSKRDDEICRLLSTGDPKGMDLLFNTYYSRLVVWADTFLKDIQLAEGVVQEFFIALWEKRKQKELTAPFLTSFLYVSVRNRCLNKLEKQDIFHNTTNAVRKLRERLDKEKFAGFLFFFCKKKSFCQIF